MPIVLSQARSSACTICGCSNAYRLLHHPRSPVSAGRKSRHVRQQRGSVAADVPVSADGSLAGCSSSAGGASTSGAAVARGSCDSAMSGTGGSASGTTVNGSVEPLRDCTQVAPNLLGVTGSGSATRRGASGRERVGVGPAGGDAARPVPGRGVTGRRTKGLSGMGSISSGVAHCAAPLKRTGVVRRGAVPTRFERGMLVSRAAGATDRGSGGSDPIPRRSPLADSPFGV